MLERLIGLLRGELLAEAVERGPFERRLIAVAALLLETMYVDRVASEAEHQAVKRLLMEHFHLPRERVDELIAVLLRDHNNWGSKGGVTFTGGEPLMQYDFLLAVLKECRKNWIHTAIETSGFISTEKFLKVFSLLDFAFVDVKNMDDEAHKWGTGVSNRQTLQNISALANSNWRGRLVLRIPTIHGFNDSDENAHKVIDFMNENGLYEINLLKFHRLGQTKWEQLGLEYEYAHKGDMTDERMSELQDLYLDANIACYVGDNTPF